MRPKSSEFRKISNRSIVSREEVRGITSTYILNVGCLGGSPVFDCERHPITSQEESRERESGFSCMMSRLFFIFVTIPSRTPQFTIYRLTFYGLINQSPRRLDPQYPSIHSLPDYPARWPAAREQVMIEGNSLHWVAVDVQHATIARY